MIIAKKEGKLLVAKLSDLIKKIDRTAKDGDRGQAIRMLDNLIKKVPEAKAAPLLKRRNQYKKEFATEKRIIALEKKHR